jgi:hypothetical protein
MPFGLPIVLLAPTHESQAQVVFCIIELFKMYAKLLVSDFSSNYFTTLSYFNKKTIIAAGWCSFKNWHSSSSPCSLRKPLIYWTS